MTDPSLVGTSANYDWGVYNAIYNPTTNTTDPVGTWRTLTKDECVYIIDTRTTCSGVRFARAKVNDVAGLIIVPDNWDVNTYALNSTNIPNAEFTVNTISSTEWTNIFEPAGCAFLPAAGGRNGYSVSGVGGNGFYWTTTYSSDYTYVLSFVGGSVNPSSGSGLSRCRGWSVRLVKDVN